MTVLNKRTIDTAVVGDKRYTIWGAEIHGFGLLVLPAGTKSYIFQYRNASGRSRRATLGRNGALTPRQARDMARDWAHRVRLGEDPLNERNRKRHAETIEDLCDMYWQSVQHKKKASTLATDEGRILRHIKPLLGSMRVAAVTRADIEKFHMDVSRGKTAGNVRTKPGGVARVRGGEGTAARTLGLLGAIFEFAVEVPMIEVNPVRGVKRKQDRRMNRFLSEGEFGCLGVALAKCEQAGANPICVNAIRLLALTGYRKGEIVALKWSQIDWQRRLLNLEESKTGPRSVPLGAAAVQVLADLDRTVDCEWVFPNVTLTGPTQAVPKIWRRVRQMAELEDGRLHDLRHSFASTAVGAGQSLYVTSHLLGHKAVETSRRYAHLADDPLKRAADKTSGMIASALASGLSASMTFSKVS